MARSAKKNTVTSALGFEAKLWAAADALRNNMDAAEYKHVVLGLIFLKYISDAFEAKHTELEGQRRKGADPEDPDGYRAASIFWVPKEARWQHLRAKAPQPTIGLLLCRAKNKVVVEYALRHLKRPIGVAGWETKLVEKLPKALKGSLPTVEEIEAELSGDLRPS